MTEKRLSFFGAECQTI